MSLLPFSAVVGQDDARLALLLGAVDPGIGGVLLTGEKGTAKTTLVRALGAVLPTISVVRGCRFSCDPAAPSASCPDGPHPADAPAEHRSARLVELPLGATDDRVTGSLDVPRVLAGGSTAESFSPGLLAQAHRGVLYVDEVNLLPDHLVDVLLDAAATGSTVVERDGLSVRHDSQFLLVGTMNPEEGELRPQLLDRFGVCVPVVSSDDPAVRAAAVRARLTHERTGTADDGAGQSVTASLAAARALLPSVELDDDLLLRITTACAELGLEGLRGDLVTARAAIAHAAWQGRTTVTLDDVREAARLALPHRRHRSPQDEVSRDEVEQQFLPPPEPSPDDDDPSGGSLPDDGPAADSAPAPQGTIAAPAPAFQARTLSVAGNGTGPAGRRSRSTGTHGRAVGSVASTARPELLPTLRSVALRGGATVTAGDLRRSRRAGREANLIVLVLDTSGSLAARRRSTEVATAALSLLEDAYRRRDRVALIAFRGAGAETVVPPTGSVRLASRRLERLPVGGTTPIAAGLQRAAELVQREGWREPGRRPLVVLVSDGRATGGPRAFDEALAAARVLLRRGVPAVVVDAESGPVRLGLAAQLADAMGAEHLPMPDLVGGTLAAAVRRRRVA